MRRMFFAVFLLLVLRTALTTEHQNELDTLPEARQAAESDWLPNDWYLQQKSEHRRVFNRLAGEALERSSFETVAVAGRILCAALFAWGVTMLAWPLGLKTMSLLAALLVFLPLQTAIGSEWMISALETKPFAYGFCLLALAGLVRKRLDWALPCLGLVLSFHLLVGIYASLSLGLLLLLRRDLLADGRRFLAGAAGYVLTGGMGLWAVINQVRHTSGPLADAAAHLYVHLRVPHHTLPSYWIEYRQGVWAMAAMAAMGLGLAIAARRHRSEAARLLAAFGAVSSILFGIGLVGWLVGSDRMLQLYWFRFPGVIVPLTTALLLAVRIQAALGRPLVRNLVVAGVVFGFGWNAMQGLDGWPRGLYTRTLDPSRIEVQQWIRENTPPEAVFLLDAAHPEFYVLAQRARLVSFKHSPQAAAAILEWHQRLLRLNGGAEPQQQGLKAAAEISEGFRRLDADALLDLASDYHLSHALLEVDADPFDDRPTGVQELHRNQRYVVYWLEPALQARSGGKPATLPGPADPGPVLPASGRGVASRAISAASTAAVDSKLPASSFGTVSPRARLSPR